MYNKKKKKFDCKRKITFFYLKFSSNATLKNKNNDFLCQLHFLRLYHFWLMYFLFLLFVNTSHFHDLIRKKNQKNKARTRLDDGNAVPKYCGGELKPKN